MAEIQLTAAEYGPENEPEMSILQNCHFILKGFIYITMRLHFLNKRLKCTYAIY